MDWRIWSLAAMIPPNRHRWTCWQWILSRKIRLSLSATSYRSKACCKSCRLLVLARKARSSLALSNSLWLLKNKASLQWKHSSAPWPDVQVLQIHAVCLSCQPNSDSKPSVGGLTGGRVSIAVFCAVISSCRWWAVRDALRSFTLY